MIAACAQEHRMAMGAITGRAFIPGAALSCRARGGLCPMKHITIAALIGLVVILGGWRADDDPHQQNAALWYWRCINLINLDKESAERYEEVLSGDAEPANDTEIAELIEKWDEMFDCAMAASRKPVCRFGIDREQGFDALLPHLAPMRTLAKMSHAQALHLLAGADIDGSLKRVELLSRIVGHVMDDDLMISYLVSISISGLSLDLVEKLLETKMTDQQNAQCIAALKLNNELGSALFPQIVHGEREILSQWMQERCKDDPQAVLTIDKMVTGSDIFQFTDEELKKQIDRFDAQMGRLEDAARAGDDARFDQLLEDVQQGKHGVIARLFMPAFQKMRGELGKLEGRRNNLIARLEAEGKGDVIPSE
jgi:hypothetical protein